MTKATSADTMTAMDRALAEITNKAIDYHKASIDRLQRHSYQNPPLTPLIRINAPIMIEHRTKILNKLLDG